MSKKDFKGLDNPALAFISSASMPEDAPEEVKPIEVITEPEAPKEELEEVKPKKVIKPLKADGTENKTKHIHLMFKPSIFEDIERLAIMNKSSVNSLVNKVLADYIETNKEKLETYKKIFE